MRGIVRSARRRGIKASAFVAIVITSISLGIIVAPGAGALNSGKELIVREPAPATIYRTTAAERAKGLIYAGLTTGVSSCPYAWALRGASGLCTHGPDAAPEGIDVTRERTIPELVGATDEGTGASTSSYGSVPCYGDGTSGQRVQVVYAHAADVADRFGSLGSSIVSWSANVDKIFNDSAAQTGGTRHVRFVTDSSCKLVIQRVQLSTTGDDTFSNTINELKSVGLTRSDRKYLIWVDANVYCGIANLYRDDSAALTNANNVNSGYARIDQSCWGYVQSTEAHELMHLLGGVQYTAPHTSGGGHCVDDYDRMCYADATGVTLQIICGTLDNERLFDCNHDDYFSTNPPAGSYLATHWNAASSSWLEALEPSSWSSTTSSTTTTSPSASPTPTTSPSPTVSPSPSPPPATTVTYSGSLNRKIPSRTYTISVGSGALTATLKFSKTPNMTVALNASNGTPMGSQTGGSPTTLTTSVSSGTYSVVVRGSGNASFTLTVTYTSA